jgi:RNA polymerase sigma factor (sigma-70 family)
MALTDQTLTLAERIYRKRGADLLSYLRRRLRHDADARDIAQEAFLRLLRLDDQERLRNPEAYLFRIAGNLLWERRLRQQREPHGETLDELEAEALTPLESMAADEELAQLSVAINSLPAIQRAIMVLHLREGMSFSQIAAHTGMTTSLAKKHYYKGVMACRQNLATASKDQG